MDVSREDVSEQSGRQDFLHRGLVERRLSPRPDVRIAEGMADDLADRENLGSQGSPVLHRGPRADQGEGSYPEGRG